jgi:hypothetical protein
MTKSFQDSQWSGLIALCSEGHVLTWPVQSTCISFAIVRHPLAFFWAEARKSPSPVGLRENLETSARSPKLGGKPGAQFFVRTQ